MGNPYPHGAFMADAGFSNVEVLDSPRPQKLHLYLAAPTTDSVAHMSKSLKAATGLSRCTYCSSSRQSAWPVFSPSFTTRSDGGHDAVARGGSIVAGGDLPQLSLRATVSIRLRATEIRRCQAPWRRPPQSSSRGCLRERRLPAWQPPDGWRRRRGHHG